MADAAACGLVSASGDRRGDRLRRCVRRCAGRAAVDLFSARACPATATAPGVTVASRARPDFDPPGVRVDSFLLHPQLEEGLGYDDNVFGSSSGRRGSWLVGTHPSLLVRLRLVAQQPGRLSRCRRPALSGSAAAEPHQLDGVAGWRAGGRARPAHRVGGASRPAPGAHRARCAAVGRAGRLSAWTMCAPATRSRWTVCR